MTKDRLEQNPLPSDHPADRTPLDSQAIYLPPLTARSRNLVRFALHLPIETMDESFAGDYPKFRKNLKKIAPIWHFRDRRFCKPFIISDRVFQLSFVVPKNYIFFLTRHFFFVICCVHVF